LSRTLAILLVLIIIASLVGGTLLSVFQP